MPKASREKQHHYEEQEELETIERKRKSNISGRLQRARRKKTNEAMSNGSGSSNSGARVIKSPASSQERPPLSRKSWCNRKKKGSSEDSQSQEDAVAAGDWCETCQMFRDGDESAPRCKKTPGRRKIEMKLIQDSTKRSVCFSKRKAGLLKKASELGKLTDTQILLVMVNANGHRYDFSTPAMDELCRSSVFFDMVQRAIHMYDAQDPNRETDVEEEE